VVVAYPGIHFYQTEKFAQVFKKPFNSLDYKQLYIFKGILMELNSNIFVELPLRFSHFTRFFIL
jgi:hypothetical protein